MPHPTLAYLRAYLRVVLPSLVRDDAPRRLTAKWQSDAELARITKPC